MTDDKLKMNDPVVFPEEALDYAERGTGKPIVGHVSGFNDQGIRAHWQDEDGTWNYKTFAPGELVLHVESKAEA